MYTAGSWWRWIAVAFCNKIILTTTATMELWIMFHATVMLTYDSQLYKNKNINFHVCLVDTESGSRKLSIAGGYTKLIALKWRMDNYWYGYTLELVLRNNFVLDLDTDQRLIKNIFVQPQILFLVVVGRGTVETAEIIMILMAWPPAINGIITVWCPYTLL